MNPSKYSIVELPFEIGIVIASSLQALDVCSLSSCSRYWWDVCKSDQVWESLFKDKWPASYLDHKQEVTEGWKKFYEKKHRKITKKVTKIANLLDIYSFYGSVEITYFMEAVEILQSAHFTFEDVQLLFFKQKLNVVLNLVGLFYCIMRLYVPAKCAFEALTRFGIVERRVCIRWKKFRGHTQPDNFMSFSLGEIATAAEDGVFRDFELGSCIKEFQILISSANSHWQGIERE